MADNKVPAPDTPVKLDVAPVQSSSFSGKTIQFIAWRLLGILLSVVTLGIAAPWAHCMILRWETKHTYVNGKRLYFDGKGGQLFGKSLLWGLLTVVTFGIYLIFLPVRFHKWRVSHTRFAKETDDLSGPSGGKIAIMVVAGVLAAALLIAAVALFVPRLSFGSDSPTGNSGLLGGLFDKAENVISFLPSGGSEKPADDTSSIVGTWYCFQMSAGGNWLAQPRTYTFNADGTCGVSTQDSGYTYSPEVGITAVASDDFYMETTYTFDGKTISFGDGQSLQVKFKKDVLYIDGQAYYQGDPQDIALRLFTQP